MALAEAVEQGTFRRGIYRYLYGTLKQAVPTVRTCVAHKKIKLSIIYEITTRMHAQNVGVVCPHDSDARLT